MSDDARRPAHESRAWILVGLTGSAPGILSQRGGRLAFRARRTGALAARHGRRLAALAGQPELMAHLESGQEVRILDEPVDALRISFPWYWFGGGMKVRRQGDLFRFSFLAPANTLEGGGAGLAAGTRIRDGRRSGRRWRGVLMADRPATS